jgi:hypothetical protein
MADSSRDRLFVQTWMQHMADGLFAEIKLERALCNTGV